MYLEQSIKISKSRTGFMPSVVCVPMIRRVVSGGATSCSAKGPSKSRSMESIFSLVAVDIYMIILLVVVDISVDRQKGELGINLRPTEQDEVSGLTSSCRKDDEP